MSKQKIRYNPALSVSENAKKNGVSTDCIRYHIKSRNIDRRSEAKVRIINDCRKMLSVFPDATPYKLAKETKYSINTIKKYWTLILGEDEVLLSNFGQKKSQKLTLRQKDNFYATHPSCVRDLLKVESFSHNILEPFCGTGTMAEVLKENGYSVAAYDIVDRGYGQVADFSQLEVENGKFDIITNPPYDDNIINHIRKCIDLCKRKVAILMPLSYLSGKARHKQLYTKHPPKYVYVYSERIRIAMGAEFEKFSNAGASMTIYAWYIWEKGYNGHTELRWMLNGK